MAIIDINRNPSQRELMFFGAIVALFCGLVGLILRARFGLELASTIVWGVGAVVVAVFYAVPARRRSLYVGWMLLFFPLGFVLSHLVLGIIYYLAITPIGLIMRLLGRDSLHRKLDRSVDSYWVKRAPEVDSDRYFRQF